MKELFTNVLNMTIAASVVIVLVLALRLVLRKMPKQFSFLLWGVVFVRLVCPLSIEVPVDLPLAHKETLMQHEVFPVEVPLPTLEAGKEPALPQVPQQPRPYIPWHSVWLAGVVVLLGYGAISYWKLRKVLSTATLQEGNVYCSDKIDTPFVLGLWKPRIYLPITVAQQRDFVMAHEVSHIRRGDHWVKFLCFLAVTFHWFNPLVWLAYCCMARDMEMACDEAVLKQMGMQERKGYSMALLSINQGKRMFLPPAFNETGVKSRVRNILHYQKPAVWVATGLGTVVLATGALLLCSPMDTQPLESLFSYRAETLLQLHFTLPEVSVTSESKELAQAIVSSFGKLEVSTAGTGTRGPEYMQEFRIDIVSRAESGSAYSNTLHFSPDFSKVWLDNGIKPSLEYRVKNPKQAERMLVQAVEQYTALKPDVIHQIQLADPVQARLTRQSMAPSLLQVEHLTAADLKPEVTACRQVANEILPDKNGVMRVIKVDPNCPGTLQVKTVQQEQWSGGADQICPEAIATHKATEWTRFVVYTEQCDTCGEEFRSTRQQVYMGCKIA